MPGEFAAFVHRRMLAVHFIAFADFFSVSPA